MKRLCKILTCGDVDSGKSTLLGRLLYNTDNIYKDQLEDIKKASKKYGTANRLEYGLVFDGLLEERKQQITIDVAHRFFNIKDTRFHLFDCPGHSQYTHNFVISAAEADIAILVIDSTKGLMPQTIRHYKICKLFNIKKIILCITKIDLVNYIRIENIENDIKKAFSDENYTIFKTSAIVNTNMDIFAQYIYECSINLDYDMNGFALCIQSVKKTEEERLYQGISFGNFCQNKIYKVYPSELRCSLQKLSDSVETYKISENIDISRGYIITNVELKNSKKIFGQFINFNTKTSLEDLVFKYGTGMYNIKHITISNIEFYEPVYFTDVKTLKNLGYGIIIDNKTKLNVGIFIIKDKEKKTSYPKNYCYWFTGYSGSGKTTLAQKLVEHFPFRPILLDGDIIRKTINYNLTLSDKDRDENVKKIANLANMLIEQGFNVVVACISKDLRQRAYAKMLLKDSYVEIFIDANEETRKKRDTKGLYKNNIKPLADYEKSPWEYITINTDEVDVETSFTELLVNLYN